MGNVPCQFDDIIVYSNTIEEHTKHFKDILNSLKDVSINVKIENI